MNGKKGLRITHNRQSHRIVITVTFICFITLFLHLGVSLSSASERQILFGIYPYANPSTIYKNFSPLIEYLSEKTGRKISILIAPNYITHILNIGKGKVDMGFLGPSPYVKVHDKFGGIELLARIKLKGDENDRMVFVTRQDSTIKEISDLKGKTFAFGDYQSFGSHYLPRYILNKSGVRLRDLIAYDYVKSHDNVILSVLHKDFDAGGVREDIFLKYKDRPLRLFVGPIMMPPHVIVCRTSLGKDLIEKLRKALHELKDESILKSIDPATIGFLPVSDEEFNFAREVVNFIESR